MKVNINHIKAIMQAFVDSETAFTDLTDVLQKYPVQDDAGNDFVHHYLILIESGFVSNRSNEYSYGKFGLISSLGERNFGFSNSQVRLTAAGHEFYDTLNSPSFTERLSDFKDQPIEVMKDVGKELVTAYLKNKLGLS